MSPCQLNTYFGILYNGALMLIIIIGRQVYSCFNSDSGETGHDMIGGVLQWPPYVSLSNRSPAYT